MNELIVKFYINKINKIDLENLLDNIDLKSKEEFDLDIVKNNEFDAEKSNIFPDGFLYFEYIVEYYKNDNSITDYDIENTKNILKAFWNNNYTAIAVCDFEDKLPENRGYQVIKSLNNSKSISTWKNLFIEEKWEYLYNLEDDIAYKEKEDIASISINSLLLLLEGASDDVKEEILNIVNIKLGKYGVNNEKIDWDCIIKMMNSSIDNACLVFVLNILQYSENADYIEDIKNIIKNKEEFIYNMGMQTIKIITEQNR